MSPGKWIDELIDSIDKFVWLETTDGLERQGKITGYSTRKFTLNGKTVHIPIDIELNGDTGDRVPLDRVARMKLS